MAPLPPVGPPATAKPAAGIPAQRSQTADATPRETGDGNINKSVSRILYEGRKPSHHPHRVETDVAPRQIPAHALRGPEIDRHVADHLRSKGLDSGTGDVHTSYIKHCIAILQDDKKNPKQRVDGVAEYIGDRMSVEEVDILAIEVNKIGGKKGDRAHGEAAEAAKQALPKLVRRVNNVSDNSALKKTLTHGMAELFTDRVEGENPAARATRVKHTQDSIGANPERYMDVELNTGSSKP